MTAKTFVYDPENPDREGVLRFLCDFLRGAGRKLVIQCKEPTRSLESNARMWCLLADVSKQVQWPINGRLEWLDSESWKTLFSAALNHENRMCPALEGTGVVVLGLRTSKMTVREMSDLQALIEAWGTQHGVKWSEPEARDA